MPCLAFSDSVVSNAGLDSSHAGCTVLCAWSGWEFAVLSLCFSATSSFEPSLLIPDSFDVFFRIGDHFAIGLMISYQNLVKIREMSIFCLGFRHVHAQ